MTSVPLTLWFSEFVAWTSNLSITQEFVRDANVPILHQSYLKFEDHCSNKSTVPCVSFCTSFSLCLAYLLTYHLAIFPWLALPFIYISVKNTSTERTSLHIQYKIATHLFSITSLYLMFCILPIIIYYFYYSLVSYLFSLPIDFIISKEYYVVCFVHPLTHKTWNSACQMVGTQ